jgi:hypothetical protein
MLIYKHGRYYRRSNKLYSDYIAFWFKETGMLGKPNYVIIKDFIVGKTSYIEVENKQYGVKVNGDFYRLLRRAEHKCLVKQLEVTNVR